MSTINLRVGNDALTFAELDANFTNLNNDKYESGDDASLRSVTFTNLEKSSTPATDGSLAFDSSQGLLLRRTQQNVTNAVVTVLDGSNVEAGTSINISNLGSGTNGGGTSTEQFTFDHADVTRNANTTNTVNPGYNGSFTAIDSVVTNAQGHVTDVNIKTVNIPASDNTDTLQSIADDTSSNSRYVSFVDSATGAQTGKSSAILRYQPSTATIDVGNTTVSHVRTSKISCKSAQQLVLNAGESEGTINSAGAVQNAEIIYMNAENGVQINSSSNNWVDSVNGGWATRQTLTLNDSSGNSSFPGDISAGGNITGNNLSGTNTGDEPTASASTAGIVELATTAETTAGTDATRAVTPDGLQDGYQGSTNVTTLGTIGTGTWQSTKIASAYLDDDTAHLSTTQTFTGAKTFNEPTIQGDTGETTAASADQIKLSGFGFIGNRAANPVYVHNNGAGGVQIGHGTIGAAGQIALFTDSSVDLTARLDVAYDVRIRGSGSSADQGVAALRVSSGNTLTIDAGNDGSGLVTIGSGGLLTAVSKSFDIAHPTKEGMRLRYGSLEGPENGVYVRGRTTENVIELPDYWTGLVDHESITVHITPIGKSQSIWVKKIEDYHVHLRSVEGIDCFYTIYGERKDTDKLIVEYGA